MRPASFLAGVAAGAVLTIFAAGIVAALEHLTDSRRPRPTHSAGMTGRSPANWLETLENGA